ncbi:MAG: LysM peptidoglycan-binding domain-containing protein [Pontiellaceae bacterium]|nr:LysM peptidoglycan-binding domain-containing protein [Pontiellaceae bacterium]MBN2785205.1 LysM peptidoglycan-binding domain-containing protein [Pontiellaceae bacterium]
MKIKFSVVGAHAAVLCAFSLTQGCLTTGTETATAPRLKAPFKHQHKGKENDVATSVQNPYVNFGNEGMIGEGPLYVPETTETTFTAVDLTPDLTPVSTTETYIIQKGDTLSQLAVSFDTTTADLVRMNNLSNPDTLYVGQELQVPAGHGNASSAAKSGATTSVAPSGQKAGMYTIKKGDTLSEIAVAAGVSIDELRRVNGIKGDKIWAGQEIAIPAGGKVPSSVKKSSATAKKSVATSTTTTKTSTTKKASDDVPFDLPPVVADTTPAETVVEEPVEGTVTTAPSVDVFDEYVLYPGETLDDVARVYMVSKEEIMKLNGITDESQVQSGTRIRIPISE